ncbi:MAG TPA: Flp family type IVb pilin [Acidisphaera sp.]|nr:Flp family type IVb pilin [Acidisphaera sp.]
MRTWIGLFRVLGDRRGISATEYALMGALIAAGILGALSTLQGNVTGVFGTIGSAI